MIMNHPVAFCDFCGKSQLEVVKIISGPKTHICAECVARCAEIIAEDAAAAATGDGGREVEA
jgi:ATP-dependent Clp protease ATP-binding subunit ClpX